MESNNRRMFNADWMTVEMTSARRKVLIIPALLSLLVFAFELSQPLLRHSGVGVFKVYPASEVEYHSQVVGEIGFNIIRITGKENCTPFLPPSPPAEGLQDGLPDIMVTTDAPAANFGENAGEQPAEIPGEQPAEIPGAGEQPAEIPGKQPAEIPGKQPAEIPEEQPANIPADTSGEKPIEDVTPPLPAVDIINDNDNMSERKKMFMQCVDLFEAIDGLRLRDLNPITITHEGKAGEAMKLLESKYDLSKIKRASQIQTPLWSTVVLLTLVGMCTLVSQVKHSDDV